MQGEDFYSGAALGGAGSGAASGAMIGGTAGPWGAAAGGLIGGALGLFGGAEANSMRSDATKSQSQNLDAIMAKLRQQSAQNYARHISDMKQALAFYGPAQTQWDKLYGSGTGAQPTGQGSWSGTNISATGAK